MRLPSERWLKVVFVVTAVVFASVALYIYALRFFAWAESDAAVTVVLAGKILDAGSPVVDNWYYANGDVWCFGPHLLALLPVAVLGIGPASLLIAVVAGFALELSVLVYEYARLCSERWIALFAAMVTLTVWSQSHAAFVYAQLAYGYSAVVYLFLFAQAARLAEHGAPRAWRWLALAAILAVLTVQNPTRAVVFGLAPLLAACAWPWRGLALRRRLGIGAALVAGWAAAYAVYALVFTRVVQFSVPRGFTEFAFADRVGIAANLGNLARGLWLLCGDGTFPGALPGLIVLIGAIGLVVGHQLESRALTRSRFLCTVVSAQFIMICVPLVIGNLLVSRDSVRYLIPSLITMFGLAAILAVRAVATAGARSRRWLAAGWLGAVPVAALFAMPGARPPQPVHYVWPDVAELARLGDELARRHLTHGFANMLGANALNLHSRGATLACPIYFREIIMPLRWLADTSCYRAAAIPQQFYVVVDQGEHDARAVRATLPPPVERFQLGSTYAVEVFRTADVDMRWLDLPIADGAEARFPMEIAATHLQMIRSEAVVAGAAVVATGAPGTVIYGPYMALPRGSYELVWIGRGLDAAGDIEFRVHAGNRVFARAEVHAADLRRDPGELTRLAFRLNRPRDAVEFVVRSTGGGRVELQRLVIDRR